jgi:DNA-binding CsgD family transcriptional regulator
MSLTTRLVDWVDFTADLLQQPVTTFPHEVLTAQLLQSFETSVVSWEWRESADDVGCVIRSATGLEVPDALLQQLHEGEILNRHPLLRWFGASRERGPQTIGRVPVEMCPASDRGWVTEVLQPLGAEQQMSIPYRLTGGAYGAFVLSRSGADFSVEDMEVARRVQRLIRGLHVQTRSELRAARFVAPGAPRPAGLTGSELAVLALLAEGHTAFGIARRLSVSPRTVNKHLEHVYRKLGVSDRLRAVSAAASLGIASPSSGVRTGRE